MDSAAYHLHKSHLAHSSPLCYLSLGSNLGDREHHLRTALSQLSQLGKVVSISSLYETEPVEFTDQPWFLNCCAGLQTSHTPHELLAELLEVERNAGRIRQLGQGKGPRILDMDIVLWGALQHISPDLTVPHPAMHLRKFVLAPLAEIAADAVHPGLNQTVQQLLDQLAQGQTQGLEQGRAQRLPIVRKVAASADWPVHLPTAR